MTTIAYRDGVLAFDGQASMGDYFIVESAGIKGVATKHYLAGTAGNKGFNTLFLQWEREGMPPDKVPKNPNSDEDFMGIVINRRGIVTLFDRSMLASSLGRKHYMAIGSGREYAMGALAANATAPQAVGIASKLDPFTGGKIRTLSFEGAE